MVKLFWFSFLVWYQLIQPISQNLIPRIDNVLWEKAIEVDSEYQFCCSACGKAIWKR